ncbi:MAG: cation:proton antiporter [Candidatus Bipolaricaulaceae bacterium]
MRVLAEAMLALGVVLVWVGGIGMVRFRSPYVRLQVAGVADVGGTSVFLIGLVIHEGWAATGGLALALLLFVLFTGPLATHAIAKSAFVRRVRE